MKKLFFLFLLFISNTLFGQVTFGNLHMNDVISKSSIGLGNADNTSDANKPVSTAQQTAINGTMILMASGTGISGATLASTVLTYTASMTLATHIPTLVVYKYVSGTLGIGVAKLKNSAADISALTVLLAVTSTQEVSAWGSGTLVNSGNLSVEVTTASLAASSFNVYVYGTARP